MTKIKKLKRRKKFRANVNRKRLRNKLRKLPNIECKQIKEAWEMKRSTVKNLEEMGLAYDPNRVLKIPHVKHEMLKVINDKDDTISDSENVEENIPKKVHVVKNLEEEARHPRAKLFRLPNNEVHFITYMMDKYGDNYEAMVKDRKNYNQLTWRQIKRKIERFKSIPEQYAEYLVKKGEIVLEDPTPLKKIKVPIIQEPIEKKTNSKPSRRKRKQAKVLESSWQEESIVVKDKSANNDSTTSVNNEENENLNSQSNKEQKLQLFSDDDNNENDDNSDVSDFNDRKDKKKRIANDKVSKSNKSKIR